MATWNYNPDEFSENSYELIPEGVYRVRIEKAEEPISRNTGKDMIKLTLAVSGYNSKLWSYTVLDNSSEDARKRTNQHLGTIFSSFGITPGNMDTSTWEGKVGGCKVKHSKDQEGKDRAEVHYFLYRKEVDTLPDWQENKPQGTINPDMVDFDSNPNNIPF